MGAYTKSNICATPPEIVNETSSVVVGNVDQDRVGYKLSLRNASGLAVDVMVVSVFDAEGRCKMHSRSLSHGHLMPPGTTIESHLSFPVAGEDEDIVGADGISCSDPREGGAGSQPAINSSGPRAPKIVIEAVDFEDGSYEGDARKAAMLEGFQRD